MVQLLARFFIKNYEQTESPSVRQSYGVLCGSVGIGFNILLFIGKFLAGLISNSIAITADAFNNLSDAGSSLITLIGFKMAGQKPDTEHPFGHGRIEYLTGLLVSLLILLMGVELIKSSVSKILYPEVTECTPVVAGILIVSILVKLYMYLYNRSTGRKIDSAAMMATAVDSLSDMLSTSVVLIATLIGKFTGLQIDGWCGLLVGIFILYAGFSAAKDTISPLLGQPPQKEFVEKIESIVQSYPQVLGIHDLIVHDYGPGRVMISLHAEVPASGDMLHLHDTIDNIERQLHRELHCDAVIHMDPVMNDDEETQELKKQVTCCLHELDKSLNLHDFRIVKGPTHTNIIFDILVPFKFQLSDAEISRYMEEKIHSISASYYAVINIDKDYTI
ncbi:MULTISPECIES: cation diffusion facilitator family transporter [Eisenbergiella]|uniref:Cation transporter n=1 Tax=Eisenbergiella porci TaxID=2652274 RepID=A0A6N7WHD9_9FIRM|nr:MULTISPECIES: cation diffusion facilitator family transporter [Eisenbergiella]MDY2653994.1 cation diffusion facilitator family transporter [Eisenbergiella porci]MSS90133.1 cation transporter [Eisenbergiella porci]